MIARSPTRRQKASKKTTVEDYNCSACEKPDSFDNMVQCDNCEAWCHYSCAGVTSSIALEDWSCSQCVTGKRFTRPKFSEVESASAKKTAINLDANTSANYTLLEDVLPINCPSPKENFKLKKPTTTQNINANNSAEYSARQAVILANESVNLPTTSTEFTYFQENPASLALPTNAPSLVKVSSGCATSAAFAYPSPVERPGPSNRLPNVHGSAWSNIPSTHSCWTAAATPSVGKNNNTYHAPESVSLTTECYNSNVLTSNIDGQNQSITNTRKITRCVPEATITSLSLDAKTLPLSSTKVQQEISNAPGMFSNLDQRSSKSNMNSRSSKSSRSKRIQIELKRIEEERELKAKRDEEYLRKKYQILSQISDHSSDDEYQSSLSSVKVDTWLTKNDTFTKPNTSQLNAPVKYSRTTQQNDNANNFVEYIQRPAADNMMHQFAPHTISHFNTHFPSHTNHPTREPHTGTNLQQPSFNNNDIIPQRLSRNQIAARQLMSRDLHTFSGNAEEWPVFISNFTRSTNLCGFSDEENLMRLQKALKGEALNAVRSILIHPQCVDQIIRTLKTKFGRPQVIIQAVLQKIHETPPPKEGNFESIVDFSIEVQNYCATIEASGLTIYLQNPSLLQELESKLPHDIRLNWATYKRMLPQCTLHHFNEWMIQLADAASCVVPPISRVPRATNNKPRNNRSPKDKGFVNAHFNETNKNNKNTTPVISSRCFICEGSCASVENCRHFLGLSRTLKWETIRKNNLCRRCLGKHEKNNCQSMTVCGVGNCSFKHHRLLHSETRSNVKGESTLANVSLNQHHTNRDHTTLFRVVPVTLYANNVEVKIFAFLDDGSSVTLLDEEIAAKLNLKGIPQPLCLKWTGDTSRFENTSELVSLQISGNDMTKYSLTDVHTVKSLCLPRQSLNIKVLQDRFEHLKDLNIESYSNVAPRLLIGLNNTKLGLPLSCREGRSNEPIATKTRLGWVVHGNYFMNLYQSQKPRECHSFHMCECNDDNLQRLVNDFILNDKFGTNSSAKVLLSTEDERALSLLNLHSVRKDGRFETSLLWKFDDVCLPNSLEMAKRRLACLHKRMKREPILAEAMSVKISEYLNKGYARKLSPNEIWKSQNRVWYLPIFPVFNPNKPGKLRIVWDAAAKVQGVSLNSFLLKGPDNLTPLISVLFKFREERIAICGDIMEMFHQIRIRPEDQNCQRFLWSRSADEPPDVYAMSVMTFGASCSPSCAQFIKNKNADDFVDKFPRAVRSIKENHYVDDLMDSTATEEEAVELAMQIRYIHQQGGFYIRNWISNSAAVLKTLKSEQTENKDLNVDVELTTEKVLGMWWCTSTDCFTYKVTTNQRQREVLFEGHRPTKREVLKILMTIFDPLGLLAHFLMYVKILLQDIWRSKIDWDTQIQDAEFEKWRRWVQLLPAVEELRIPRCYTSSKTLESTKRQLHIFVDASESGFAAVAYVRTSNAGKVECTLIGAKTRVAPLKHLSIPRLELQAAVLGARFAKTIIDSHSFSFSERIFWSDSKNVLSWLRSDHRRYRQFVACRVSEILDITELDEWRWVPTKLNVADEGTKWHKAPEFSDKNRWFSGPLFLRFSRENWPQETCIEKTSDEEIKTYYINLHTVSQRSIFRITKNSSWNRLLRSTAYVFRFLNNCKNKNAKRIGVLKCDELQNAFYVLMRETQGDTYKEELAELSAGNDIDKGSPIYTLCPYLDKNNIMRIRGRIDSSNDTGEYVKRPIILPRGHPITDLILMDKHLKYHHQNHETAINDLRQMFFIPRLRMAFKTVRKSCQDCKNEKVQPREPMMAQLPPARLASFSRPFSYTGIDYFGPLTVSILRRTEKRWGVLFTCLTTRAVHIEVAHSMSADSCILAIRNFIARRGTPNEIYSDNGTNFQGAERELREALKQVNKEQLMEAFTSTDTSWKFIPPGSPHMGGSWERLIRSVKKVLYKIMPTRNPTEELLRSMMLEVENIINSRPLTYLPIENVYEEALTPNHFLLGSSNGLKPAAVFNDNVKVVRNNWLASQQYADHFWKRWVSEYLPTLTRRSKWFAPTKPIKQGDIVLIVDPKSPRNCWPKGRVIDTKVSKDGQVRSVSVQTTTGIYVRPAIKIAVLDIATSTEEKNTRLEIPGGV